MVERLVDLHVGNGWTVQAVEILNVAINAHKVQDLGWLEQTSDGRVTGIK